MGSCPSILPHDAVHDPSVFHNIVNILIIRSAAHSSEVIKVGNALSVTSRINGPNAVGKNNSWYDDLEIRKQCIFFDLKYI